MEENDVEGTCGGAMLEFKIKRDEIIVMLQNF